MHLCLSAVTLTCSTRSFLCECRALSEAQQLRGMQHDLCRLRRRLLHFQHPSASAHGHQWSAAPPRDSRVLLWVCAPTWRCAAHRRRASPIRCSYNSVMKVTFLATAFSIIRYMRFDKVCLGGRTA